MAERGPRPRRARSVKNYAELAEGNFKEVVKALRDDEWEEEEETVEFVDRPKRARNGSAGEEADGRLPSRRRKPTFVQSSEYVSGGSSDSDEVPDDGGLDDSGSDGALAEDDLDEPLEDDDDVADDDDEGLEESTPNKRKASQQSGRPTKRGTPETTPIQSPSPVGASSQRKPAKPATVRQRLMKKMGIDHRVQLIQLPKKGSQPLLRDRVQNPKPSITSPRSSLSRVGKPASQVVLVDSVPKTS